MKFKIFLVMIGSFLTLGCSSKKESRLTILMPSGDFPQFAEGLSAMSVTASKWNSGLDPVSISDVNCYGLIVSGPETTMKLSHAIKENGDKIPFGPWVAAVPAGSSVELMVPAGKERKIYMLGFRANTSANCYDFRGSGPDYSNLSRPYVVGSASLNLEPGDVKINLNISMSGAYPITEFSGAGFGGAGASSGTAFFGDGRHGDIAITSAVTNIATNTAILPSGRSFIPSTRITNIDNSGRVITIAESWGDPTHLEAGDEIFWIVAGSYRTGNMDRGCGGLSDLTLGRYGFAKVESTNLGSYMVTLQAPLTTQSLDNVALANTTFDGTTPFCYLNMYRVPQFNNLNLSTGASFSGPGFDYTASSHGVLVMKVNDTLTLSGGTVSIGANGRGFAGGTPAVGGAGSLGVAVSVNARGNASDGTTVTSNGSAGGANNGNGGMGTSAGEAGLRGILCANVSGDCPPGNKLFFGGASGGSQNVSGVSGGGVVIIRARNINFNSFNLIVSSDGVMGASGSPGDGGSGGGGGGGVLVATKNMFGSSANSLTLKAYGGMGGVGSSGGNGGGGGGAGAVELQTCQFPSSVGVTLDAKALGGAFGSGTTNGTSGQDGFGPNPLGIAGNIGDYSIQSPLLCAIP